MKHQNKLTVFSLLVFLSLFHVNNASAAVVVVLDDTFYVISNSTTMQEKIPSLALMVASGMNSIEMAWIPGSDGLTPVDDIRYDIHLGATEDFTPEASTLKMSVTGVSQAEVTGLEVDTLYFGKVIAFYSRSTSEPSNELQSKTYTLPVQQDGSATVAIAADLGLGQHTTGDGITYTYSGGTPPTPGSVLFSEDTAGGTTVRTVDSSSVDGGTVTVVTSDACLTDALDIASVYSSLQLFDVASQAQGLPAASRSIATARTLTLQDGTRTRRVKWKNRLLMAEQINYAYDEEGFSLEPGDSQSVIRLCDSQSAEESFTATVTAEFEPKLITSAEWGGTTVKVLDSAKVAASGTLTLTALAEYDFAASGSVSRDFELFERTWTSVYSAGPVPVYQEITLSMNVVATASASAEVHAHASASVSETVEVGAVYNGSTWEPYIETSEEKSLTASLDSLGTASAEIRLIPMIEVVFYQAATSSLSVEPFVGSSLSFEETTNNPDFLLDNPERLVHITTFDASLGLESNLAINLSALGMSWDVVPQTCVLGTGSCLVAFDPLVLFSLPEPVLSNPSSSHSSSELELQVTDGTFNVFDSSSVEWLVYPDDGTITPGSCSKLDGVTTCSATFTPPYTAPAEAYTVFASGHGIFSEIGRQFKEVTLSAACGVPWGAETVTWEGNEWQRCDDGNKYSWEDANDYCEDLELGGHSDWRLPEKDELKSLVVCTNGIPTPLPDCGSGGGQCTCNDWTNPHTSPTIDPSFMCQGWGYWSSTISEINPDYGWYTWFDHGGTYRNTTLTTPLYVRCAR